jgi:predicted metal-dependent HD superfamily phosphohydrolase
VYDTHHKDNEERSADFAEAVLRDAGMASEFVGNTRRLILATKHAGSPEGGDTALLTDIDLSILGQPREVYTRFEQNIRSEYAWVSDADFTAGRCAILKSFLARPSIYAMVQFRLKYETPARSNLEWAIAQLAG